MGQASPVTEINKSLLAQLEDVELWCLTASRVDFKYADDACCVTDAPENKVKGLM